jgi:uncharacterized protein (DUF2062 family)
MWDYSRATLRRWAQSVLHTDDTPERTAIALGLGVAIGFSPFLGFRLVAGIVVAFLFNLNRLAVLVGLCLNLPWLMGPYYAAATAFGAWLTGASVPADLVARLESIWALPGWGGRVRALAVLLRPFVWAFVVGSLVAAAALGLAAYAAAKPILLARERRRRQVNPTTAAKPPKAGRRQ